MLFEVHEFQSYAIMNVHLVKVLKILFKIQSSWVFFLFSVQKYITKSTKRFLLADFTFFRSKTNFCYKNNSGITDFSG
jgi:hypothetical protein